jgi:hypothetical protein
MRDARHVSAEDEHQREKGGTHYKDSERISNDNNRTTGTTRRKEGRKKKENQMNLVCVYKSIKRGEL